jgi:hypothetical protein
LATAFALAAPIEGADRPEVQALIISGLSGDPKGAYARNMRDWKNRFVALIKKQGGVPDENFRVLTETPDAQAVPLEEKSTRENVRKALDQAGTLMNEHDQFILVMLGHGTVTEPTGKLCLPGPDLTATELARALDGLPTQHIAIINCASGGAEFLRKYSKSGRVVISAAGVPGQGQQTYFAEFFLLAHETGKGDADGDGHVSMLEAFNWAAGECVNWYHRQYKDGKASGRRNGREILTFRVEGKESRRIFRKLYAGTNIRLAPSGNPDAPDTEPDTAGRESPWEDRRETNELASLEDRGEETGALHWVGNKHVILEGRRGEQGAVAARTVLGKPEFAKNRMRGP